MDIGWIAICSLAIIYSLYKAWKNKEEFFLLLAIGIYLSLFYVGGYKLIQYFEEEIAARIDTFSLFLLVLVFMRYLLVLYKKYREVKKWKYIGIYTNTQEIKD